MPLVTLIGEKLAKKDTEFVYLGPNNECRNCKLKTVCFNLKPGRRYKVSNIRDKKHNCNVHEGAAAVIEVEELPIVTSADKNLPKGEKTKIKKKTCTSIGCVFYELCSIDIQKDKNYTIAKIFEEIDCPHGYGLNKVELQEG
jgi:uncharacterized protein (UPF0179 family)